jgi:hypothetical protein
MSGIDLLMLPVQFCQRRVKTEILINRQYLKKCTHEKNKESFTSGLFRTALYDV